MSVIPSSAAAPPLLVVAAAIGDSQRRWLLQQRPAGKHHSGLWEFPGGKVDPGEEPRSALVREIVEELGLSVDPAALRPLGFADEATHDRRPPLVLLLFSATAPADEPVGHEGQEWGWFTRTQAAALPLAPLDRTLLACLPADPPDCATVS